LAASSGGMPVQNFGLVLQLHRRWVLYQLQQMGRAALSPLSTAKRAVSCRCAAAVRCCMLTCVCGSSAFPWPEGAWLVTRPLLPLLPCHSFKVRCAVATRSKQNSAVEQWTSRLLCYL
jgi:hypothetical protein